MAELQVSQTENTLVLTKEFDAPRELVFEMFKNPAHLEKWWGPETWPATVVSYDFVAGGAGHYYMQGPDGTKAWGKTIFEDIDEPNSITYLDVFSDEVGNVDDSLPQAKATITFSETEGKTTLTSTTVYKAKADLEKVVEMGMIEGLTDTWGQLERLIDEAKNS